MTDLTKWKPCNPPGHDVLVGQYCELKPYVEEEHLSALFDAVCGQGNDTLWSYVPLGPFDNPEALGTTLAAANKHHGWQTMVIEVDGEAQGMASYMRVRADHGSAEVGCVIYGHDLQRTRAASETIYLMGRHLFEDLGYRRYEWKCNNANEASKRAALRFGFRFEGVFRNDMVMKGKNRDTAWYAMTDEDWRSVKPIFDAWLLPGNFDENGVQRSQLRAGGAF